MVDVRRPSTLNQLRAIARARVKSKHFQQKVHQIGWFCLFELRMGPLESRNDFAMVFFRKDFHPRRKLHPQISL